MYVTKKVYIMYANVYFTCISTCMCVCMYIKGVFGGMYIHREGVPCVKVYLYNPKHPCPKSNS